MYSVVELLSTGTHFLVSTHCINSSTINTFRMHVSSELKSGAIKF